MERSVDVRSSFDGAVEDYDEVRPSYPPALFDALFQLLPAGPEIVEVGPGTGKATGALLARGASVRAIELGPAMAARLRANHGCAQLHITVGDFETVDIVERSADALFAATSYHWISPAAQTDRPATILRPGGVVAIVDLIQVESPDDDGFFATAQSIYARWGQVHRGPPAPTRDNVEPPIRAVLESDPRYTHVAVRCYDWNQRYTASQYRKLMLSYSTTQMMVDPDRVRLLDDIESLVTTTYDGTVTRPLVVTLTTATIRR